MGLGDGGQGLSALCTSDHTGTASGFGPQQDGSGFGHLPCKDRLQNWAGSTERKDGFWGHPPACPALSDETREIQPGSTQQCVAGGQEAAAQAETQESQAGYKKPFTHKDNLAVKLGPKELGPALGRFMPQLGEALISPD